MKKHGGGEVAVFQQLELDDRDVDGAIPRMTQMTKTMIAAAMPMP